jgi:phosphoglycolate phosphatase-like HAD superfamily hydrolase
VSPAPGARPAPPGLRHVVLDLDDTIVATAAASLAAWIEATARLGLQPPDPELFVPGYRDLTFRACFRRWYGDGADFEEFGALYRDAVRYGPIGDVPALLRGLRDRGITAGVVTNSTGPEAARKLVSAGIPAELFDFVAGRPEGADGPAPDGPAPDGPAPDGPAPDGPAPDKDLVRILAAHRIDPATAVHVSDNPADHAPSVRAGVPFRGVLTGVWTGPDFAAAGVAPADVFPDVHAALAG